MQQRKKHVMSMDALLNKPATLKSIHEIKYNKSLSAARASENDAKLIEQLNLRSGYWSLRSKIIKNPWVSERPSTKATQWLFKEVFKQPEEYRYSKRLMYQGGLFAFAYLNPKYKGTSVLPWFDKFPLVVSLGPISTNLGIRNIGFNLHLLPPKIRIVVICSIFEMYKRLYRYQVFFKQDKPIMIDYRQIIKSLDRLGIRFCVRVYIPNRMSQIVRFPIKSWHKAIFIPSRGYDGIRAAKLIEEWKKFCKKNHYSTSENIDWKTMI